MSVSQQIAPVVVRVSPTLVRVTPSRNNPVIVQVGIQGPAGPAGLSSGSTTFAFHQSSAIATWTIVHNLGKFPSVATIDTTGREVEGDVTWPDSNTVIVNFTVAMSGTAYLN